MWSSIVVVLCIYVVASDASEKLNVHLVCHTHNDVGWKKTVTEYFMGANNTIQHAGVQYILDSVMLSLEQNPSRKFIYVEVAFFQMWWNQQNEAMQETVRGFVKSGQLEFINGGWCMNDEAAAHYNGMIDQMTLGHQWLMETFGVIPTIGWHIDPFGHSATQAVLFAEMGFNAFFLGRVDYQDKAARMAAKTMEMIWRSSPSLGAPAEIFTGVLFNMYSPPPTFCWDINCFVPGPPMQDDVALENYNIQTRVNEFVKYATQEQAPYYTTNNIMMTMGMDFHYENANEWFKNLDKLINYVNADGRINVFYSTPSQYVAAVHAANAAYTVKTDDFFPYSIEPFSTWSGYYTSRPTLKAYERASNNILQACKQLELTRMILQQPLINATSELLREVEGILQHHDAVTGTAQQHVTYDYELQMTAAVDECQVLISDTIAALADEPEALSWCPLLNISVCDGSSNSTAFSVVFYNPLGKSRWEWVRVPVPFASAVVTDATGDVVPSQVLPVDDVTVILRGNLSSAPYNLVFGVEIPPLGYTSCYVRESELSTEWESVLSTIDRPTDAFSATNGVVTLGFDANGYLASFTSNLTGEVFVVQDYVFYNGSAGNNINSSQTSDAYVFRPNTSIPFQCAENATIQVTVVSGPLLTEIRQIWSDWTSQIIRLWQGADYVDMEFTIGPIPYVDQMSKEVVTRFWTNITTNGTWYTDANGREMQLRRRNYRPTWTLNVTEPVAGNYFPVATCMFVNDSEVQMLLLTDRSQGGGSLHDGEMEIMQHRRLLYDDSGMGQPLNETGPNGEGIVTRGKHRFMITHPSMGGVWQRLNEELVTWPTLYFFSDFKLPRPAYSGMKYSLPESVHLLSFERTPTNDGGAILRLAHMLGIEEGPLSVPVVFNVTNMFDALVITNMTELTLSANQPLSNLKRMQWNTADGESKRSPSDQDYWVDPNSITLAPMQIRTFLISMREA